MVCVSSHDLESDYPWSGLKDENSPTPELTIIALWTKIRILTLALFITPYQINCQNDYLYFLQPDEHDEHSIL